MDPLIFSAAMALVAAMGTDGWQAASDGAAGLWRSARPDLAPAIEAELAEVRGELLAARQSRDFSAEGGLAADWARKLERLVRGDPALAAAVALARDDQWLPLLPSAQQARVRAMLGGRPLVAGRDVLHAGRDIAITSASTVFHQPFVERLYLGAGQASADEPVDPAVLDAAQDSYLDWVISKHQQLQVPGLAGQGGVVKVPLDRMYVALRVDPASQTERDKAREMLLLDLAEDISMGDFTPEEEEQRRWWAQADLPAADHLATAQWLARFDAEHDSRLNIGQMCDRASQIVILGEPGSGKTTILRWLALMHARALRDRAWDLEVPVAKIDAARADDAGQVSLGRPMLPVLVRIPDFLERLRQPGAEPLTLLGFLAESKWFGSVPAWTRDVPGYQRGDALPGHVREAVIRRALTEQRALIMLDGLDEVVAPWDRLPVSEAVTDFLRLWAGPHDADGLLAGPPSGNKVLVTSRIAGYHLSPLPGTLLHVTIEPMTDQELAVFLRGWMQEVTAELSRHPEPPDKLAAAARQRADGLLDLLHRPDGRYVRELATNPLLASTIATVYQAEGGQLPRQHVEVFQKAIDRLVAVWDDRLTGPQAARLKEQMLSILGAVAFHIHRHKPTGVIPEPEFRTVVRAELQRTGVPDGAISELLEALLRAMRDDVGLLAASAPGAYRFCHLTFQEFLAARHLMTQPALGAGEVMEHLGDPRWHEPTLMLIGLANWQCPDQLASLTEMLLAAPAPLADLFPEAGLLLAEAIPRMADVPGGIVTTIVARLLHSLTALTASGRLPRIRRLVEEAVRMLRDGDQREAVDDALADALMSAEGGALMACATAALIGTLGARTPHLIAALARAAPRHDQEELGFPIAVALGRAVSSDPAGDGDLDPDQVLPLARMRAALRIDEGLAARVRGDSRWLALIACLFGGYPDLGTREVLRQYNRMVNYLSLDGTIREGFAPYFAQVWQDADPDLRMAEYVDEHGVPERQARYDLAPEFTADAITRDSPFTLEILRALRAPDGLAGLVAFLVAEAAGSDAGRQAEAAVALWALGHDIGQLLPPGGPGGVLASQRIAALRATLRDATVRAAGRVRDDLGGLSRDIHPDEWRQLLEAVTIALIDAGAEPFSVDARDGFAEGQHWALVEELSHRFSGWGDDPLTSAAVFADGRQPAQGHSPATLVAALNDLGRARHARYGLYAHWWPGDPLAFPNHDDKDVPIGVLDLAGRVPGDFGLARSWFLQDVLPPLITRNPALLPEVLAVALSEHAAERAGSVAALDPDFGAAADPAGYIRDLSARLASPWHRARALARLAEMYPDDRDTLAAEAAEATGLLADARQRLELHEWLARLASSPARWQAHVEACAAAAARIADPADAVLGWLRVARLQPADQLAESLARALPMIRHVSAEGERARLLRLIHERYADDDAVHAAIDAVITEVLTPAQQEYATGDWGAVISRHLPVLTWASPDAAQAWMPVVLYARSLGTHDRFPRPGTGGDPDSPFIQASGAIARQLDKTLGAGSGAADLASTMSRLVNLDPDSEPIVRRWLWQPSPQVRRIAALLLAEYRDLSPELLEPVVDLLRSDDDILRHRASFRLSVLIVPEHALSRIGSATVTRAADIGREVADLEPALAQRLCWMRNNVLADVPAALSRWCDAVDEGGDSALEAAMVLPEIRFATEASWRVVLDRLVSGTPSLQVTLLVAIAAAVFQSATDAGQWLDGEYLTHGLRMTAERWAELWEATRRMNLAALSQPAFLVLDHEAIASAVEASLAATDGLLTGESVALAERYLGQATGTSFGAILALPEDAARQALYQLGRASYALSPTVADAAIAQVFGSASAPGRDWPWVQLLVRWTEKLLAESVNDPQERYGPRRYLRTYVLEVTAAAADLSKATFRQCADETRLATLLARALRYQRTFTGRRAAARLLGLLRRGSQASLAALRAALADVGQVNREALEAIPRLRHIDQADIDDLSAALYDDSAMVAWAAAQLLSTISQAGDLSFGLRARIIGALTVATQDPRSRRTVHFAYVPAAIPGMTDLDDAFAEALRRVYHFGERPA
ncbi:MAG TPA: hypothetical protein VMU95_01555 [Trebonia sp.]|nr:hypothetical protein [Trebonia sp.]